MEFQTTGLEKLCSWMSLCESGQMSLNSWHLAGVSTVPRTIQLLFPAKQLQLLAKGFCWAPGTHRFIIPGSGALHSHKLSNESCEISFRHPVLGGEMWANRLDLRGRNCWDGSVSLSWQVTQGSLLCLAGKDWKNVQTTTSIFNSSAFLLVKLLSWLLSLHLVTGKHH